jgi:GNAT superfamily N-acetyltransferase
VVAVDWQTRPSTVADARWMAELRAVVMREDLERLGRFDPQRVRERFLTAFEPGHTVVIVVDGRDVGLIAVRPEPDSLWIEHFYLDPSQQGQGIGAAVLRQQMAGRGDHRPFRLNVLQGSAARRLYERHGFVFESEDEVDVFLVAPPLSGRPTVD